MDTNNTLILKKGDVFSTFAEVQSVVENYAIQNNTVIILGKTTRNTDGSGYRQVSFVCKKQGQYNKKKDETKDIFSILSSISSKYIHKHDIYNAVSRQRLQKLQGLNEIEMLLKTLHNDENIMANIAIKPLYNDERDQDGAFIQAIFWIYCSTAAKFALSKDVLIIDATYKTNRFSMPLIVICSIDRFGTTYLLAFILVHSETQNYYHWTIEQLSKALIILTGNSYVATIITNREFALMVAISTVFPSTKHQLCTWHILKNIKNKLKKDVDTEEFNRFLAKVKFKLINDSGIENQLAKRHKNELIV
ncbi:13703_t:CDS:2, partial [Racocetra persica]